MLPGLTDTRDDNVNDLIVLECRVWIKGWKIMNIQQNLIDPLWGTVEVTDHSHIGWLTHLKTHFVFGASHYFRWHHFSHGGAHEQAHP